MFFFLLFDNNILMRNWYTELNNSPFFKRGPRGIIIYQTKVKIRLEQKAEHRLEQNSSLETNIPVGMWVKKPVDGVVIRSDQTAVLTNPDVFRDATLQLMVDTDKQYESLDLTQIDQANQNGHPFYLNFGGTINLSESTLSTPTFDSIAENEVLQFNFDYVKLAHGVKMADVLAKFHLR